MRRPLSILLTPFALHIVSLTCTDSWGQEKQPLRLVQTIPMQNVKGRIDQVDVDVKGRRLFVAGLENGSVEVVDLRAGKWLKSIPGFQKSHGIAYVEPLNKMFVASGDDRMLRAFRGDTLDLLDSIKVDLAPNRVIYDPHTKLLYVGYGGKDAGKEYGEVGIVGAKTNKHVGDVKAAAHPAELLLGRSGATLFVFRFDGEQESGRRHEKARGSLHLASHLVA